MYSVCGGCDILACEMKTSVIALLFASFVFWLSPASHGQAGGSGGNGGGIAEMRFASAFRHAFRLFLYCSNGGRCGLTESEMRLTRDLLRVEKEELAAPKHFEFRAKQAEFFTIAGQVRIAKTGSEPGTLIYGNLDMMYRKNANGEIEAISYPEAVQAVVHELGHHVGRMDHDALDDFGAKYAEIAKRMTSSSPIGMGIEKVRFTAMNNFEFAGRIEIVPNPVQFFAGLSVEDGEENYEISQLVHDEILKKEGLCLETDRANTKCLSEFNDGDVIQSVQFYNLRWEDFMKPLFRPEASTILITGDATVMGWRTRNYDNRFYTVYTRFVIELQVQDKSMYNDLRIIPGTIRLRSIATQAGGVMRFGSEIDR